MNYTFGTAHPLREVSLNKPENETLDRSHLEDPAPAHCDVPDFDGVCLVRVYIFNGKDELQCILKKPKNELLLRTFTAVLRHN